MPRSRQRLTPREQYNKAKQIIESILEGCSIDTLRSSHNNYWNLKRIGAPDESLRPAYLKYRKYVRNKKILDEIGECKQVCENCQR